VAAGAALFADDSQLYLLWMGEPEVHPVDAGFHSDRLHRGLVQAHNGWRGWTREPPLLEPGGPRTRTQKTAMVASIVMNLSLLGFFKYFNFGIDNYLALLQTLGFSAGQFENVLRVTLPLGISFYTFQSMSYSIDVYRGDTRAMRSANDYFCFVAMYQQLVAGPIVRFSKSPTSCGRARTRWINSRAAWPCFPWD
jgi:hypothetical protein